MNLIVSKMLLFSATPLIWALGAAAVIAGSELKGAAILDHPCGADTQMRDRRLVARPTFDPSLLGVPSGASPAIPKERCATRDRIPRGAFCEDGYRNVARIAWPFPLPSSTASHPRGPADKTQAFADGVLRPPP